MSVNTFANYLRTWGVISDDSLIMVAMFGYLMGQKAAERELRKDLKHDCGGERCVCSAPDSCAGTDYWTYCYDCNSKIHHVNGEIVEVVKE